MADRIERLAKVKSDYNNKVVIVQQSCYAVENWDKRSSSSSSSSNIDNNIKPIRVTLNSPRHDEVYEINGFYAEMFSLSHFSRSRDSSVPSTL